MSTLQASDKNHYERVKEVLTEIITKGEKGELHPIIYPDKYYEAAIEYLSSECLELKDDFTENSVGYKYKLVKKVNVKEAAKEIVEEYENYFNC